MKFAIVNGIREEPTPKLRGICPCCGSETIAKCGRFKIWHWAHKSRIDCDAWWENETEWHRRWKNQFPVDWQERVMRDTVAGGCHIADVYTDSGIAVEFQHSILAREELDSREAFYRNVVWVVDGSRNEFDRTYFNVCLGGGIELEGSSVKLTWGGRGKLFERWNVARCPVFFDFGDGLIWKLLDYNNSSRSMRVEVYLATDLIAHLISPTSSTFEPSFEPLHLINQLTALHRIY